MSPLRTLLSLEVVPSQDIVHAPRPDQVPRRVGDEIVTRMALVQAGVNEPERSGAVVGLVKIDAPVSEDLGRQSLGE